MKARKQYCAAVYYLIAVVRIVLVEIGSTAVEFNIWNSHKFAVRRLPFSRSVTNISISRYRRHYVYSNFDRKNWNT